MSIAGGRTEDGFRIEAARDIAACRLTATLQEDTWSRDLIIPPSLLLSAIYEGGYVGLGYGDGDRELAGFVFGFQGSRRGQLRHHSQRLAVRPRYRRTGLAQALKEAQREHCLAEGVNIVTWTMDPLQPRNARFNFSKLGAYACTYLEDFYGPMDDKLNAGLPSDRLCVEWAIATERVDHRLRCAEAIPSIEEGVRDGASYVLRAQDERPCIENAPRAERLLIEVPADIQDMKLRSHGLAVAWRLASRAAFASAFKAGYVVVDLLRSSDGARGAYLLTHGSVLIR